MVFTVGIAAKRAAARSKDELSSAARQTDPRDAPATVLRWCLRHVFFIGQEWLSFHIQR